MAEKNLRFATLSVVCVAHFLMPFMMSAVGVALPVIGREFHASAVQLGLIETSYVASASIFLLAMGRLGDIVGRRKIFQIGLGLFTLAGGLISQAWAVDVVIGLRFFQGMGGAMVMATTMAIVVAVFPEKDRGKALGIAVASVYAGISCGPFIGGTLVSILGWRSIFYLCIPLGLTALLTTTLLLRDEWVGAAGEPFDWQGWLIYAVSIASLVVGATHLAEGVLFRVLLAGGVCGVVLFLWFESRRRFPLLNMDLLLHNRVFALSNLAAMFNYAGTFSMTFFLSLFLQVVLGFAPHEAGGVLIIQPLVQTLFSPVCGRLSDRYPADWVATAGMALCALGIGMAATLTAVSPLSFIVVILVVLGLGFALFSSPNTRVIMTSVAERDLGVASGFSASMRTLGMMGSMTIVTVIFSWQMAGQPITPQTQDLFIQSMHIALLIFSGLCAIAVFSSFGRHQSPSKQSGVLNDE
ncbi:MFS transporter [uncultured Desulfuromonas sp.]|uniref:MFS transporter n=2 Tax=Desulfuromonas TaxID=890 RepID=UPI002AAB74C5|nr:MFS transporter [uncultured Desulfuromonas sp.]